MPTVIVAEPHAGMAAAIAELIDRQPGMVVIARTTDRPATARLLARHRPDVLLLDSALAGDRLGSLALLQHASPDTRIVLTGVDDHAAWPPALGRGYVAGYISKASPASAWGPAIVAAAQRTSLRPAGRARPARATPPRLDPPRRPRRASRAESR